MPIQRLTILLAATGALLPTTTGCQYFEEVRPNWLTQGTEIAQGQMIDPQPYPGDTPIGAAYDIEVVAVNGKVIQLDNRTVRRFENAELWLNQQYGGRVGSIEVGSNPAVELNSFVNEHGEPYPTAKFLASDEYSPLVSADLIIDGKMHKLLVRLEDWRKP